MSRFEDFINTPIRVKDKQPLNEQIFIDDCIINFENGYISNWYNEQEGVTQPAIECIDGHIEFWERGKLHSECGPAVISSNNNVIEYWDTSYYRLGKTGLKRLHNLEKEYPIGVVFAIINKNRLESNNYSFVALDTMDDYGKILEENMPNRKWGLYPVPMELLTSEIAGSKVGHDKLLQIFGSEKEKYPLNKYHFSDILDEYINANKYKKGKTKEDNA